MDKADVYKAIQSALLNRFETAKWAAKQAHDAATNEESVAENKYDTFGLEASYLAHGQSQRVIECERDWLRFQKVEVVDSETINLWCLVKLVSCDLVSPVIKYFFISPCAGGLSVEVDGCIIYLVTPSSPVGKKLIGKATEEEIELSQNGQRIMYEIELVL
jgi:hypothetical protein